MPTDTLHRRSIRLRGYDYTRDGAYFVTICTENRRRLFGTVVNGRMALNDDGRMIQTVWNELPAHYPGVDIDAFVVMPDHIHGIVCLRNSAVGAGPCACPSSGPAPTASETPSVPDIGQARGPAPTARRMSLPDVVHRFKSLTTKRYIDGVTQHGWPRFDGKLWHRNYYEIIVRDTAAMTNIRWYIHDNPAHWDVLRYGEPRFFVGNRALLDLPKTAFLASRGGVSAVGAGPCARPIMGQALGPALTGSPVCVISGFLSPMERGVFDDCLHARTPMIQVLARGLPGTFPAHVQRAIDAGYLLVMTPFPETESGFSASRAAWCNQYILHVADTVIIGQLAADGMLACLLADLPGGKSVTVLNKIPQTP